VSADIRGRKASIDELCEHLYPHINFLVFTNQFGLGIGQKISTLCIGDDDAHEKKQDRYGKKALSD
jgi:hypothetical protein